jgi:hypothetical protein
MIQTYYFISAFIPPIPLCVITGRESGAKVSPSTGEDAPPEETDAVASNGPFSRRIEILYKSLETIQRTAPEWRCP